MTKEQLQKMNIQQILEVLNDKYEHNPEEILNLFNENEKEEYDGLCCECYGQTYQKSAGDEGWTVCDMCCSIEGDTFEADVITVLDQKIAYNYKSKHWFIATEDLGQEL